VGTINDKAYLKNICEVEEGLPALVYYVQTDRTRGLILLHTHTHTHTHTHRLDEGQIRLVAHDLGSVEVESNSCLARPDRGSVGAWFLRVCKSSFGIWV
jgi:hypothetical protein